MFNILKTGYITRNKASNPDSGSIGSGAPDAGTLMQYDDGKQQGPLIIGTTKEGNQRTLITADSNDSFTLTGDGWSKGVCETDSVSGQSGMYYENNKTGDMVLVTGGAIVNGAGTDAPKDIDGVGSGSGSGNAPDPVQFMKKAIHQSIETINPGQDNVSADQIDKAIKNGVLKDPDQVNYWKGVLSAMKDGKNALTPKIAADGTVKEGDIEGVDSIVTPGAYSIDFKKVGAETETPPDQQVLTGFQLNEDFNKIETKDVGTWGPADGKLKKQEISDAISNGTILPQNKETWQTVVDHFDNYDNNGSGDVTIPELQGNGFGDESPGGDTPQQTQALTIANQTELISDLDHIQRSATNITGKGDPNDGKITKEELDTALNKDKVVFSKDPAIDKSKRLFWRDILNCFNLFDVNGKDPWNAGGLVGGDGQITAGDIANGAKIDPTN